MNIDMALGFIIGGVFTLALLGLIAFVDWLLSWQPADDAARLEPRHVELVDLPQESRQPALTGKG